MDAPRPPETATDEVARLRAERDALQAQLSALQQRRRRTTALRRVAHVALLAVTCLSVAAVTVAVWADRTLLTTDGWVGTVEPLGAEPAVTAALRPRITEGVFAAIPAEELIADALPDDRAFLAVPLASGVRSFVDDRVGAFLASDRFARLWTEANEVAHARALAVLRGDSEAVQVDGGTVTLNLLPTINAVLGEVGGAASGLLGRDVTLPTISGGELPEQARTRIDDALGIDLPADVGEIPVYDAEQLILAQQWLQVFDRTLLLLVVGTPVLVVAAIWRSRDRRRTLLQLTLGSVLLLVVIRRVVLRFQEQIVALPPRAEGQAAAEVVTEHVLAGLFDLTAIVVAVGLAVVAIALLTGPYRWAVALRRGVAQLGRAVASTGDRRTVGGDGAGGVVGWMAGHRQALQVAGALLFVLLVLVLDLSWGWFLTLLALLVCWEVAVWRLGAAAPDDGVPAPS